jgi:hypothetical protein
MNTSEIIEYKKLLRSIYHNDKTPSYNYSTKERAKNGSGELPAKSKRWLTPREIIYNLWQEKGWDFDILFNKNIDVIE